MEIRDLRNYVERQKGSRDQVAKALEEMRQRVKDKQKDLRRHEQAREVIREVGLKTQRELSFHIGDISSLALDAVYDDPYKLTAEFVLRRNRTECDIFFVRGGEKVDPLSASGGGAVNVASFALRVAAWSMQRPRSRATIVLDEPLNNLSVDLMPRAAEMLKQLSKRLGLQLLIVTHSEELAECADRVFRVTIKKGVSRVQRSS